MISFRFLDAKHAGRELMLFASELNVMEVWEVRVLVKICGSPGHQHRLGHSPTRYEIGHPAFKESLVIVYMACHNNEFGEGPSACFLSSNASACSLGRTSWE